MKSWTKKIAGVALAGMLLASASAQAQLNADNAIQIGGVKITGGAFVLVGLASTTTADNIKSKPLTFLGWSLVVVGILVSGQDIIVPAIQAEEASLEVEGKDVFGAMVREAKVLSNNPDLIAEDSAIASAAKSTGISAFVLSQIVVDLNNGLSQGEITSKYFSNGFVNGAQEKAIDNLVALSQMK